MKKFLAMLLALAMLFSFAACNDSLKENDDSKGKKEPYIFENDDDSLFNEEDYSIEGAYEAVKNNFRAIENDDGDLYIDIYPTCFVLTNGRENIVESLSHYHKNYIGTVGDNYSFSVTITKTSDVTSSLLDTINSIYDEYNETKDIDVTVAKEIEYDLYLKGDLKERNGSGDAVAFLENGVWKIFKVDWKWNTAQ